MRGFRPRRFLPLVVAVLAVLTACSSTRLVNQWSNPEYTGRSFNRVMVIGVAKQESIRRTFEDEFVDQLKAAGVDAVPSYQYIPEAGPVEEGRLGQAVTQAKANAVIITRLVRREQKTEVTPGFYQPPVGLGFYGWYSAGWVGYYEPPRVYQYDVYISETSLYDTAKNQLIWSGTAETTAPGDIDKEIKSYAAIMIAALKEKNLI